MHLPMVKSIPYSMDGTTGFSGYNHNLTIGNSEFFDQRNISPEKLPIATPRKRRGILRAFTKANGLFAHEKLGWVDGTDLYYDAVKVGDVQDSEKTFVLMGAHVLIWPDKVFFNTLTGEMANMEAYYTSTGAVTAALCRVDGTPLGTYVVSDKAPENPADGIYWMDTSGEKDVLKVYSNNYSMWNPVPTVYVKISSPGIGQDFQAHDGVTISGMDDDELNGQFFLAERGDDWVVVTAIIREAITANSTPMTMARKVPDMEFMTECNNRIWGCNSEKNEIYACALGDPRNWSEYMGLSTDSYAVTVGSHGPFTGAVTHLGSVLFFKPDMIHRIMGNMPSNFTLDDTGARGVGPDSAKSIRVVNEVLYYKSTSDVCAYGQSLPATISYPLGDEKYGSAVAGSVGQMYYICLKDAKGVSSLFSFDTERQIWSREDNLPVKWFATIGQELYFIAGDYLYSAFGSLEYGDEHAKLEPPVRWMLETGDMGLDNPYNKYITGIQLHMGMEVGGEVEAWIQYNGSGPWEHVYSAKLVNQQSVVIPVSTRRCRTMKLRLTGIGPCALFSIVKRTSIGSDTYAL